ncbi:MAG: poly-gamma-glutamate system protein, partial [Xanthomonadales bacterium]|nr:poly-gamma-glutamate system protein [Xanthomonadales bacterium]
MDGFSLSARLKLLLLAAAMAGLWYLAAPARLTAEESLLWEKVRAAQLHLADWGEKRGLAAPAGSDPWACGLIGVEWSGTTTTLGELASKRTACNPAWAVQFSRWFREQGLQEGDPIAIYSSSSFPGLLLNALAAAEAMRLDPLLIVSLGASTWGANRPDAPWPVLAAELRRGGFISKRADYYTMGGDEELGNGMPPEGQVLLRKAAGDAGVELLAASSLEEMVALKSQLLQQAQAKLLISIGGSHANMGSDPGVLQLQPGLNTATKADQAGAGVIGFALGRGIPVLHLLNIKALAGKAGIPYDSEP